jgi:hypothetical protein
MGVGLWRWRGQRMTSGTQLSDQKKDQKGVGLRRIWDSNSGSHRDGKEQNLCAAGSDLNIIGSQTLYRGELAVSCAARCRRTDGRTELLRHAARLDVVDEMTKTGPAGSSLDARRSRTAGTATGTEDGDCGVDSVSGLQRGWQGRCSRGPAWLRSSRTGTRRRSCCCLASETDTVGEPAHAAAGDEVGVQDTRL